MNVVGGGRDGDHLHQQLGGGLLDLRPLIFKTEDAGLGLPCRACPRRSDAELRQPSAFQPISQATSFSRKADLHDRTAAGLDLGGEVLDARSRFLETPTRAMPVRSLPSRTLRSPALVLLADDVLVGHSTLSKTPVDLTPPSMVSIGRHGDAF